MEGKIDLGRKNYSYISSPLKVWVTTSAVCQVAIPFQFRIGFVISLGTSLLACRSLSSLTGCAEHLESPGKLLELLFGGDLVKQVVCNIKLRCLDASALML